MAAEPEEARERRRRRRGKRKRRNHKRSNLLYNLGWVVGGLAVGLPLLAIMIYALAR
ncbi:MAG: hypothetical protein J2O44_00480 [Porphyrobacter sp.]|nr:hypothetical protein [Porphyrobacter sp.]